MNVLKPEQLTEISERTLGHYNGSAASFWEGTRGHDVVQNINALLAALDQPAPCRILDFGCGPGRDLMAFSALGHTPVGLDGSANFCAMAREHSGCEVLHQDFLALDLPAAHFDGVFANARMSGREKSFLDITEEKWRRMLAVNLDGVFFTYQTALRHMVERAGK